VINGDVIGSSENAGRHPRFHRCRPGPHGVGTGVHHDLGFEAENSPSLVRVSRKFIPMLARMRGGDEVLTPVLDPANGATQLHADGRNCQLFGVEIVLDPETAANVRRHDTQAALGDAEGLSQDRPDNMGKLRRAVDDQLVEAAVIE
jgi:hypothetical protein